MGHINRIVSRPLDAGTNMPPPVQDYTVKVSYDSLNRKQKRLVNKYGKDKFA